MLQIPYVQKWGPLCAPKPAPRPAANGFPGVGRAFHCPEFSRGRCERGRGVRQSRCGLAQHGLCCLADLREREEPCL